MRFLFIICLFFSMGAQAVLPVDKPAPNFDLKGHDGKTYKLSELKGKFVVLEWFNNDCPYVDKHYHETVRNMQNLQKKWTQRKAKKGEKKIVFTNKSVKKGLKKGVKRY